MTSLDWMILAGIALAAAGGFRRGFIVGGLGLAGFAAGVLLGVQAAAALEERSPLVAPALFPAVGGLLGGALLARVGESLRWRKAATPPPPARRRDRLVRTAPEMLDRVLGAALTAGVACGLAWLAGAAALQVAAPRDVREAVRESVILAELNAVLPPTAPILDAVARFDPFPRLRGPSAEVAAPPSRIGRDRDVRSARDSVVRVVGTACGQGMSGSGWIAERGLVVTNAHVISGQDDTQVQPAGEGDVLDAVPVAIDERNDVAVLRVAGLDGRPLPMAPDPKSGVPVAVLGFPGDGAYSVRSARLGATRTVVMSEPSAQRLVRRSITLFRGTVRPGNSGGPLVDRAGRVAATVFATRREQASRTGFAVPNEAVRRALNAAAAPVDTGACADPVAQVELLQDVRDVGLDGRVADVELLPDLGVRVTVGDEAEDVELTLGQLLEIFRRRGMGNARELLDHPFRDGGREERLSAGDDGAGPECLVDVFVEVEGREDEDPSRRVGGQDPARRLEAVELGHADVHERDRGLDAGGLLDRLEPVDRLGDDLDADGGEELFGRVVLEDEPAVGLAGEQHPEAGTDHGLVVGDEDANGGLSRWLTVDRAPRPSRRGEGAPIRVAAQPASR